MITIELGRKTNDITILKEAVLRIELGHAVNTGDVTKAYVDFQDNLKVDKLAGHSLISDVEKERLENVTNYDDSAIIEELQNKVDKVDGKSLIDDVEIAKLADYPLFENLELTSEHKDLEGKNSEAAFQHVNERINEIPANAGGATYTLLNRRQTLITGTLPNGVNSTLILPALVAGERNEVILHFKTNAVAPPTLVYSGFTPVWLNGSAISMKINKQYTIVFEQINGIVKTSFGEY